MENACNNAQGEEKCRAAEPAQKIIPCGRGILASPGEQAGKKFPYLVTAGLSFF
jgi:hypothetical protein